MGYSPWGCQESDTIEQVTHTHTHTHTLMAYPWSLKKWYKFMCLQSRNRVLDVENKLLVMAGESVWDKLREWD